MIFIWLFAFGVISILELLLGPASNIEALSIVSSQFTWHFYYNMQYNMGLTYLVRCYRSDVGGIYVPYLKWNIAIWRRST